MCKQFPVFVCLTMATGQPKLFLVYFYNVHLKRNLVDLFLYVRILYISDICDPCGLTLIGEYFELPGSRFGISIGSIGMANRAM